MKRFMMILFSTILILMVAVPGMTVCAMSDTDDAVLSEATPGDADNEATPGDADEYEEIIILTGWNKDSDNLWKFYDDDGNQVSMSAGWYEISGKYHNLTETGADVEITEGFYYIDGLWRYLEADGTGVSKPAGWYVISGKYHYLTAAGADVKITEGFHYIQGKWLYLKTNGTRVSKSAGWYGISGKYHYLTAAGADVKITEGFHYIWGRWRYLKPNGTRVSKTIGWYAIKGKWYFLGNTGNYYTGFKTLNGKKYYFNNDGSITTAFFKASDKYWYYQSKNSGIFYNCILKNPYSGKYYYVGSNGRVINNSLTQSIIKIYLANTNSKMTREQRLYAMYMYLATYKTDNKNVTYERRYDDSLYVGKAGWTYNYADYILSKDKGNCYNFACAFAYMAKMLGYDSYVLVGQVHARRGGYTPHALVELKYSNGASYRFDPEIQYANGTKLFRITGYNGLKSYKRYRITW